MLRGPMTDTVAPPVARVRAATALMDRAVPTVMAVLPATEVEAVLVDLHRMT